MKILNLYSGIGGNRELWGDSHEITSVEFESKIAEVYKKRFPNDIVVVGDALNFIQENYLNYDFIWASPPCPSHGQLRHNMGVLASGYSPIIPDMTSLYGLMVFLMTYAKCLWCVENVKPYYSPLILPTIELQRHLFWANFNIFPKKFESENLRKKSKISDFEDFEIVADSEIPNKRQVLRNRVNRYVGKYILDCAAGGYRLEQGLLWEANNE